MKMRKGWYVVWPDGTTWRDDCPKVAAQPVMPGARVVPVRIVSDGRGVGRCPGCAVGAH